MTTQAKNQPIDTIRSGRIKATIWENAKENGTFYSIEISRTYKDEAGNYHDSHSFSGTELLQVARLAHIAYDEIAIRRDSEKDDNGGSS